MWSAAFALKQHSGEIEILFSEIPDGSGEHVGLIVDAVDYARERNKSRRSRRRTTRGRSSRGPVRSSV
jgi:hypothetical protein